MGGIPCGLLKRVVSRQNETIKIAENSMMNRGVAMGLHMKKFERTDKNGKMGRWWRQNAGRAYTAAGLLCLLLFMLGAALYSRQEVSAKTAAQQIPETLSGKGEWIPTAMKEVSGNKIFINAGDDSDSDLGQWAFNNGGVIKNLWSSTIGGGTKEKIYQSNWWKVTDSNGEYDEYYAYITTTSQLKAVLSGLPLSYTDDDKGTQHTRKTRIVFKLSKDMEIAWTKYQASAKLDAMRKEYVAKPEDHQEINLFSYDTFDGQGHTITLSAMPETTFAPHSNHNEELLYIGGLFGRVDNATIQNLDVAVDDTSCILDFNDVIGENQLSSGIGLGVVCGGAGKGAVFQNISVRQAGESGLSVKTNTQQQRREGNYNNAYGRSYLYGVGGIAGMVESGVLIENSSNTLTIQNGLNLPPVDDSYWYRSLNDQIWGGIGGIAGAAIGLDNQVVACHATGIIEGKKLRNGVEIAENNMTDKWYDCCGEIMSGMIVGLSGSPEFFFIIADDFCFKEEYGRSVKYISEPLGNIGFSSPGLFINMNYPDNKYISAYSQESDDKVKNLYHQMAEYYWLIMGNEVSSYLKKEKPYIAAGTTSEVTIKNCLSGQGRILGGLKANYSCPYLTVTKFDTNGDPYGVQKWGLNFLGGRATVENCFLEGTTYSESQQILRKGSVIEYGERLIYKNSEYSYLFRNVGQEGKGFGMSYRGDPVSIQEMPISEEWIRESAGSQVLLDNYQFKGEDGAVVFPPPTIEDTSEDTADTGSAKVTAKLAQWGYPLDKAVTKNAKFDLYITMDGTDPRKSATPNQSVSVNALLGGTEQSLTKELELELGTIVMARTKITLFPGTERETIFWSGLAQKECAQVNPVFPEKPSVMLKEAEEQIYQAFEPMRAYPLGVTNMYVDPYAGENGYIYNQYGYFAPYTGLRLSLGGDNSSTMVTKDTIIEQDHLLDDSKNNPIALTKNEAASSLAGNKIYFYVLVCAQNRRDNKESYRLYEYDIMTYSRDGLIQVTPGEDSDISSLEKVEIRIGNDVENELPYSRMRILASTENTTYKTLEGVAGAQLIEGSDIVTEEGKMQYLLTKAAVTGTAGKESYLYIQPLVNKEGGYDTRYGSFVQKFSYRLFAKTMAPTLFPATKLTENTEGTATTIERNTDIDILSGGDDDIVLYAMVDHTKPVVSRVEDAQAEELEQTSEGKVVKGNNAYLMQGDVIYVKCNDIWHSVDNTEGIWKVYDGKLKYSDDDLVYNTLLYVSVFAFSEGYDWSECVSYEYSVEEKGAVAEPKALRASGSTVSIGETLNFTCGKDSVIYYTLGAKAPEKIVAADGTVTPAEDTVYYNARTGIRLTEEAGFEYGSTITIRMIALPVEAAGADPLVYNEGKRDSNEVIFTYHIADRNQVAAPASYPVTSDADPATVDMGSGITLSSETAGAQIYYTTDGSNPVIEESCLYDKAIPVAGDYGGYFTVKAVAHKEGMKDSAVVNLVFRISDKLAVGMVTATPGTATPVVAGDKIILSTPTAEAAIYYTTDGSEPKVTENADGSYTAQGTTKRYDAGEAVGVPEGDGYFTVNAVAVKNGMADSQMAQFVYNYAQQVAAPYGSPASGVVTENTQVILQSSQEGAVIYYEIAYDGKQPAAPTTASTVFNESAPIVITRNTTVRAFAYLERRASEVITLTYTLAEKMETPQTSVASGSVVPSGTTLRLPVTKGTVYYTTDGSDPTDPANTAVNTGAEIVLAGKAGDKITINACTRKSGATTSEQITYTYQISQYPGGVAADTKSGSTVLAGTRINLTTDVTGGKIYYTTGAGNPIQSGQAGNSIAISGEPGSDVALKAVAVAPGTTMTGSYAVFHYQLMKQLAAPQASVRGGTVLTGKTSISLKANEGKIYYTIDGSEPSKESYEYTAPIVVGKDMTIRAVALEKDVMASEISTFSYTFADKVENVKSTMASGTVDAGKRLRLSTATPGASIYYTTDGSDPDPDAEEGVFVYDSAEGIGIHRTVNIRAVAVKEGMCSSDILSLELAVDEVPLELEREEAARKEAEAGLKPLNTEALDKRRVGAFRDGEEEMILIRDLDNGATLEGSTSILPAESSLSTKEISVDSDAEKRVQGQLGEDYRFLVNYEVVLYHNGSRIQPEGTVKLGLPIPKEYEDADVMIVYTNENGGITIYETKRENGTAYAQVDHFSSYGLVGAQVEQRRRRTLNIIWILTITAGALVALGVRMIVQTKKKRRFRE